MSQFPTKPLIIPVTRAEYEQFRQEETFLPDCLQLDAAGYPTCEGCCPEGLACTVFVYHDEARGVDVKWYACASTEMVAGLLERAEADTAVAADQKIKFIVYNSRD